MLIRALLLLFAVVVAVLPSLLRADWDGTEGRRVQIALEMLRADNWMVPMLSGEPTWAKPPLHYWMLMLCAKAFGPGFLAMRIPSVLAIWISSLAAGELMRRSVGTTAGWICAFGIVCSPLAVFVWPTAEIDPMFASLTGLAIWLLAAGVSAQRTSWVMLSGVVAGLAFLQKGPPFFLFGLGAYLVWWRHRRLRMALSHFVPLALVVTAYFVPLWLWYVEPGEMLRVANEESVGRLAFFEWSHVSETPLFWLRAILVLMPFGLWCFWEWRGARDVRMGANDLMLRMCSGGAVLAVVLLTFFPGRPTRYLLPNAMLFTFAVAPAVTHFFRHRGAMPAFARGCLWFFGVLGAVMLIAIPFVPRFGYASVGLALAMALLPIVVRTPRQVVLACLVIPIVGSWTIGLERSLRWHESKRARVAAGQLVRREMDRIGASEDLGLYGHFESGVALAGGFWLHGDEMRRWIPETRWLIHEDTWWRPLQSTEHEVRWRLSTPFKSFVLRERVRSPK